MTAYDKDVLEKFLFNKNKSGTVYYLDVLKNINKDFKEFLNPEVHKALEIYSGNLSYLYHSQILEIITLFKDYPSMNERSAHALKCGLNSWFDKIDYSKIEKAYEEMDGFITGLVYVLGPGVAFKEFFSYYKKRENVNDDKDFDKYENILKKFLQEFKNQRKFILVKDHVEFLNKIEKYQSDPLIQDYLNFLISEEDRAGILNKLTTMIPKHKLPWLVTSEHKTVQKQLEKKMKPG